MLGAVRRVDQPWWVEYQVDVPPGGSGNILIDRHEVSRSEADIYNLRERMRRPFRRAYPGTYTRMFQGGDLIMSDTPDEISDCDDVLRAANRMAPGHALIHGLGLGMVIHNLIRLKLCTKLTVVEISQDVINLAGDHYLNKAALAGIGLEIIHDDALTWKPTKGERYSVVWHDIWPTITTDNLPQMHALHRRFGRRCDWQGSWGRELCEERR
jgi:hypothetical protein